MLKLTDGDRPILATGIHRMKLQWESRIVLVNIASGVRNTIAVTNESKTAEKTMRR